jgi:hypothetical protein
VGAIRREGDKSLKGRKDEPETVLALPGFRNGRNGSKREGSKEAGKRARVDSYLREGQRK